MIARQPTRGRGCRAASLGPSKYSRTLDLEPSAPMRRLPVTSVSSSNRAVTRFLPSAVISGWVIVRRRLPYYAQDYVSVPYRLPIYDLVRSSANVTDLYIHTLCNQRPKSRPIHSKYVAGGQLFEQYARLSIEDREEVIFTGSAIWIDLRDREFVDDGLW